MSETHVYAVGTVIAFSEGEYSDFGYCGHVRAIKELRLRELIDAFRDGYTPKDQYDDPSPQGFVGWLVAEGYAEDADVEEVHIGGWRGVELDS